MEKIERMRILCEDHYPQTGKVFLDDKEITASVSKLTLFMDSEELNRVVIELLPEKIDFEGGVEVKYGED